MSVRDAIGKKIPNVVLDNVTLFEDRVELHMHIKEYVYSDGRGTWFDRPRYDELLKIEVAQARTVAGVEKVTIVEAFKANKYQISKDYVMSEENREVLQMIPYKVVLEGYDYKNLQSLSFSVRTRIDEADLRSQRGTNFKYSKLKPMVGDVSNVDVLRNSLALTREVGYFLNDRFYLGPKHQMPNGRWMTGETHTDASRRLLQRTIPNSKVADYRNIFSNAQEQFEFTMPTYSLKERKNGYFSDLMATRDVTGDVRFLYVFDYRKAYQDTALYGEMFAKMPERMQDRLLLFSNVSSVEMYRSRVDRDLDEDKNKLFTVSGETTGDNFIENSSILGALREEELNFQKGTLFLRSFSGTDREFRNFSFGKYRYSTKVKVRDGIIPFLNFQKNDLVQSRLQLQEYRDLLEQGNYNYQTDRIKTEFTRELFRQPFENRAYVRAMVTMSENSSFMLGSMSAANVRKFNNTMRAWLSPRTSTIESIDEVLRLMDIALQQIRTPLETLSSGVESHNAEKGDFGKMVYDFEGNFSQDVVADTSNKRGLNFLSTTAILETDKGVGVQRLDGKLYEDRIKEENLRFFGKRENINFTLGQNSTVDSSFSFLTPTSARVDNSAFMFYSGKSVGDSGDLEVKLMTSGEENNNYALLKKKVTEDPARKSSISQLEIFPSSDMGATNAVMNLFNARLGSAGGSSNPFETVRVTKTINTTSRVVNSASRAKEDVKLANINPRARFANTSDMSPVNKKTDPQNLTRDISGLAAQEATFSPTFVVRGFDNVEREVKQRDVDMLPNHIKAIITEQITGEVSSDIQESLTQGTSERYDMTYGSVAKVEVLIGFARGIVKDPQFVPLTRELYIANSNRNLLCRLTPYENGKVGFKNSVDANYFNNMFSLRVPDLSQDRLQSRINSALSQEEIDAILGEIGTSRFDGRSEGQEGLHQSCSVKDDAQTEEQAQKEEQRAINALLRR